MGEIGLHEWLKNQASCTTCSTVLASHNEVPKIMTVSFCYEKVFVIICLCVLAFFFNIYIIFCGCPVNLTKYIMYISIAESLCQCYISPTLFKFFFWLGYCNSIMNPIIYTCTSTECRRAFIAILTCRRCRKRPRISLTELQMKGKVQKNGHRGAMAQSPHQIKEQDLRYPLCDISSPSSSPPGTFANIPVGIELSSISLPQTVSKVDSVHENKPSALKDFRNVGAGPDTSSECKSNSNLKKWIYDSRLNLHHQFQKCSSISRVPPAGITC